MTGPDFPAGSRPARNGAAGVGRRWAWSAVSALGKLLLAVLGVLMFAPFWWALVTSVVPAERAFELPPEWFPTTFDFENYAQVFALLPFLTQIFNSLKITATVVVLSLLVSVLAAFAFARLRFPGRELVFRIFLVALMVPSQVTLIPTYILMRHLGLLDTHTSLIVPALIQVFSIFMLRQHFMSLPLEVEEAARLDGAGNLRILFQIFVPMSTPVITALAIFTATAVWNDFITPITYLSSPEKFTIPVGLASLQNQFGSAPTTVIFAGITIVVVPLLVLFLFTQRRLSEGVALTGVAR